MNVCHCVQVPLVARRGHRGIPWSWSYGWVRHYIWILELNSGPCAPQILGFFLGGLLFVLVLP